MDLEESSASLRIWYLEFYLPLYSMDLLTLQSPPRPSLFLPALFSLTLYFFLLLLRPTVGLPSCSHHADRSAGHQRGFISHSETASSLMDGSAILFNSLPLPPFLFLSTVVFPLFLSLFDTYVYTLSLSLSLLTPLACTLLRLCTPAVLFPPSLSNHSMRDYTAAGYSRKIRGFNVHSYPRIHVRARYVFQNFPGIFSAVRWLPFPSPISGWTSEKIHSYVSRSDYMVDL